MEPELERLGTIVVARRKSLGWPTRQAFADNIDLTYRVLTDLENGARKLGPKAYAVVEQTLEWRPGSVDRILSGGDPLEVTPENSLLASRLLHPSRREQTAKWLDDDNMASILRKLLMEGHIEADDQKRVQDALDDMAIKRFPEVFGALSRPGKIRVVKFGEGVRTEEFLAQKGAHDAVADETQSATPPEGNEGEEAEGGGEEVVRPFRPAYWDDAPPPPPIELADAASQGYKESDDVDDGE